MSLVKIIYLEAAGRYRRKKVKTDGTWPRFLLNNGDTQVHLITGRAVFPQMVPMRLNTWRDLQAIQPPPPPQWVESRMAVCEDNSFWLVDIRPFSSHKQKAIDCDTFFQETLQRSKAESAAEVGGNSRDRKVFIGCVFLSALGAIVIFGNLAITQLAQNLPAITQIVGGG